MTPRQVEGVAWRKSTYSGGSSGGECVEIAFAEQKGMVRDSKNVSGVPLYFGEAVLRQFFRNLTTGDLG